MGYNEARGLDEFPLQLDARVRTEQVKSLCYNTICFLDFMWEILERVIYNRLQAAATAVHQARKVMPV